MARNGLRMKDQNDRMAGWQNGKNGAERTGRVKSVRSESWGEEMDGTDGVDFFLLKGLGWGVVEGHQPYRLEGAAGGRRCAADRSALPQPRSQLRHHTAGAGAGWRVEGIRSESKGEGNVNQSCKDQRGRDGDGDGDDGAWGKGKEEAGKKTNGWPRERTGVDGRGKGSESRGGPSKAVGLAQHHITTSPHHHRTSPYSQLQEDHRQW